DYVDLNKRLLESNQAANQEIAGVNISSYASPDGTLAFNTELAEQREVNTTRFMENQLKKDKITEFGELTSQFTPEDWEGFQQLVSKSNIQDKDLILQVLQMYKDPEQREQEIRNLSSVFNELADQILPQLRYSRIQASINVIGKSDEELINLFNTDPQALTEDEILYVATLTNDNTRKMEVYQKATELFPKSYRAYNNLGLTKYEAGDYAAAQSAFQKAKQLDPSSKEVDMNLGLVNLLDGNYNKANELIGAAAGVPEAADALGVYYLTQGEVAKANTAFGNAKTNNSALAKILAKDYSAASSILSSIQNPDADTYYLAAVVAANTNNESGVLSNLKKAISLDNSMLAKAQKDLVFSKFNLSSL
ncbi:MAG: tetratricopeptide repeat protein, partial [Muribaculaceae bacterium]|nr:tetratricopeptide repeat protein [Muribaculaceae bacterium]